MYLEKINSNVTCFYLMVKTITVLLTGEQSYGMQMMLQNDLFKNKELVRGGHIVSLLAVTKVSKRSKKTVAITKCKNV